MGQATLFATPLGRDGRLGEVERDLAARGEVIIIGVDEAGRGPLAGPVAVAAACLPEGVCPAGLDDSKRLTARRREALFDVIKDVAIAYHVALISPQEIDRINILQATFLGMRQCVETVGAALSAQGLTVQRVVIDGKQRLPWPSGAPPYPQISVIKGDQRSVAVAAASILAKVTRDRLMREWDTLYPHYGFAGHKGYPTVAHKAAVAEHGPSPVHRLSFRGVREHVPAPAAVEETSASQGTVDRPTLHNDPT